ncbi:Methyltransferase-like protein 12, mitochondrial [Trichoplax sp. H2]|uniref:Methyltransferase domain-containing protein n=1 Tax=Trichoplax adhaerens TaxID=10228 RepID=B3SAR1_TRIAD|nr:hypothetical protein TRIADDRAFT_61348 [Trichoplax adhaerens]EDV20201.1 hypothetical protein TRIADDRAFT_61348 [Trichoplax adhaerens]RDD43139.1 Methyltransferase-like protein 12, mitochondrial [Trichoplax sp. H2]|eukprot:XP_002117362.1 hypothetical protein TRIADDRAFT_61348 [Trichoplax adhaerens]
MLHVLYRRLHRLAERTTWEKFYAARAKSDPLDWFLDYQHLKSVLQPWIFSNYHQDFAVLDLGCGISDMAAHIFLDLLNKTGKVDCIDFSQTAIERMQKKYKHCFNHSNHRLSYICADATSLPFADCSYDMVLDKGTMDAAIRHQNGEVMGEKIIAEALRVMACPSQFVQISDEDPDVRLQLLYRCCNLYRENTKSYQTSVKFRELGSFSGIEYLMYTIEKKLA